MDIQEKIKNLIKEALKNLDISDVDFVVEHPEDLKNGDYSTNVAMAGAKKLQINPRELAEKIGKELLDHKSDLWLEKVEAKNGFINFYLSPEFFRESVGEILENKNFGKNETLKGEKIIIEHTQPNPFKTFHIGHLMNNAIGESVGRIIKTSGADIKVASYHGDVGLHVAKAISGLDSAKVIYGLTIFDNEIPENILNGTLKEQVEFIGICYATGSSNYESIFDKKEKDKIHEINKKIFNRTDKKINRVYDWGKDISLHYFEYLYKKLNSHFDYHFYESEAGVIGKNLVLENIGKIFEESEGAVVFKGENFEPKTHTRVFLNKDKLPTYEAKEVGLAKIKKDLFTYDKSITVTANEQDAFFDVVEVAIGEVFPEIKGKLKHLSHGMLKLPSGKMSSRTGSIISAEDLINQVKEKVLEKIKDRDFSEIEKDKVAEMVSIGAIKYSILHQGLGGDIIFDFEKSISFEGDSGPYLQYSFARANSIIEKAKKENILLDIKISLENSEITEIEKMLYRFPEIVERSAREYEPHYIANYLIEIARAFNSFYGNNLIVNKEDTSSSYKVALTSAFATVMKKGLNLLGIEAPERM